MIIEIPQTGELDLLQKLQSPPAHFNGRMFSIYTNERMLPDELNGSKQRTQLQHRLRSNSNAAEQQQQLIHLSNASNPKAAPSLCNGTPLSSAGNGGSTTINPNGGKQCGGMRIRRISSSSSSAPAGTLLARRRRSSRCSNVGTIASNHGNTLAAVAASSTHLLRRLMPVHGTRRLAIG